MVANINSHITARFLFARQHLNQDLFDELKRGIIDAKAEVKVAAGNLQGQLAVTILQHMDNLGRFSNYDFKAKKGTSSQEEEAEQAYSDYATFIRAHYMLTVSSVAPLNGRSLPAARYAEIRKVANAAEPAVFLVNDGDPVVRAWHLARQNQERAHQRVGALLYLASQVQVAALPSVEREHFEDGNQLMLSYLHQQALSFSGDETMFAVALGGEPLAITRERVFKESLSERYGVIQYLEQDRRAPGEYQTDREVKFRAKLTEYKNQR